MNEIFLDTETTGLSFREGHKIVEIACIETRDLIPTKKIFHKLINPKRDVPEEAFKDPINKKFVVDSLEVARNKFSGSSNSLDGLCKRFNIDLSRRVKHNALLDCELLREVYINLLDAKEPKLTLAPSGENELKSLNDKKIYSKKILKISEIDIENHKKFLKSELKKNYY